MANLFVGARHAMQYRKYRPTYPQEVYDAIIEYCRKGSNALSLALDLGCGSGQSTFPLAPHFKEVVGLDPSETQIQEANCVKSGETGPTNTGKMDNVSFKVGSAEDLSEHEARSIDLITCAQSFHWLDMDRFYPEAQRVLREGGVLAAYGYGNVKVDREEANEIIWEFYKGTVGPHWDRRRHHIDNHLSEFTLPFDDYKRIDCLSIVRHMPLSAFIGYISSWSAYQTYMKKMPDSEILQKLQEKLCRVYGSTQPDETQVQAKWPVFILLGRQSGS